jgi:very-short-patch-repair endonuclease
MPSSPQNLSGDLGGILNEARKELLDFGLRNPLLNFKSLKSKGLTVVDERARDIYRMLVREAKRFSFLPVEEGPSNTAIRVDEVAEDDQSKYTDRYLQTALTATDLKKRLLATYYAVRTAIEEQGVNTLFIALGMLHWQEDDAAEETHRAPLLLIPVELERSNARERFHLQYSGAEFGENISLAEFLKQSFGIRFPELPETDDLDVPEYFGAVREAVASQPRWSVEDDSVVLGFFSFSKFLMYRDLNPATWPNQESLLRHAVLNDLLGTGTLGGNGSSYQESDFLDDYLKDGRHLQVVDADSSQSLALLDVSSGRNLVIQGPPGTGKSQTIVNMIAEGLASGKRILFVAEKMVALQVVKRRLDAIGHGPACLELHSNKTNKKTVIEELKRTAQVREPLMPRMDSDIAALDDTRRRLNDYCLAVNTPVGKSEESPYVLYGRLLQIQERLNNIETPRLELSGDGEWSQIEFQRKRTAVQLLQDRVTRCGLPSRHPFWGSRLRMVLPTQRDNLRHTLMKAADAARDLGELSRPIAALAGFAPPISVLDAETSYTTCLRILEAPDLTGLDTGAPEWSSRTNEIREALLGRARLRELHQQWDSRLQPDAWEREVQNLRAELSATGALWWRFFSPRWRAAKKQLQSLIREAAPGSLAAQLEIPDVILEAARHNAKLASLDATLRKLFGVDYAKDPSNSHLLIRQLDWIASATAGIRENRLAAWCFDIVQRNFDRAILQKQLAGLEAALSQEKRTRSDVCQMLELDAPLDQNTFADLQAHWSNLASRVQDVDSLVAYNQACDVCETEHIPSVVRVADVWPAAGLHVVDLFDRVHISNLLELAFRERPALANFDGAQHNQTVERFRQLDRKQIELNRLLVSLEHARRLPSTSGSDGEIGVLWHEFEKKARFMPLRKLMLKAGNAIQAIKPVFMMSPLSIANFVPPGALDFDLVIFDEASQVKPCDALGAIVRGRQVVVVGDSKQLPPTNFFESMAALDSGDDEDEIAMADIESILGLFCSRGAHERMLRWHYRSRHESLIAVSNHLFYDDRLVVFPSPDRRKKQLGLIYHRIDNAPYDRGRTRTNPAEARVVAEAVMTHAREELRKPRGERLTLGVAAFSIAQTEAIQNQIEMLQSKNPACEEFFAANPYEEFFVKNLENVQGDERDVIFISIGYGATKEGFLPMSFGPLNRAGGERRLNVLISRARHRCEVFTTLTANDIDLGKTPSLGVAALKTFLAYAETGKIDIPLQTNRPQDSIFEEQVMDALTRRGYTVHSQVGCAGFFLDLAIVDPDQPGHYILGIECDGAAYHSARSARDRDRLRQAVLEGLSWQIYRVWSTDWFRNPDKELDKVVGAIQAARLGTTRAKATEVDPVESSATPSPPPAPPPSRASTPSYQTASVSIPPGLSDLHSVAPLILAELLAQVVIIESPIYWPEAARRVANAAGIQRLGNRIHDAFQRACTSGSAAGKFEMRGEFLWRSDMIVAPVRDRSELPQAAKKIEYVAPEEIRAAIERVARDYYGIAPDDVAAGACRLLGFGRVSDEMRTVVERERDALVTKGRLVLKGDSLIWQEGVDPN